MDPDDKEDQSTFTVVVNDEGQYSIWPKGKSLPKGWRPGGKTGSRSDCLAHIKEVWTDLRPASLRRG